MDKIMVNYLIFYLQKKIKICFFFFFRCRCAEDRKCVYYKTDIKMRVYRYHCVNKNETSDDQTKNLTIEIHHQHPHHRNHKVHQQRRLEDELKTIDSTLFKN